MVDFGHVVRKLVSLALSEDKFSGITGYSRKPEQHTETIESQHWRNFLIWAIGISTAISMQAYIPG